MRTETGHDAEVKMSLGMPASPHRVPGSVSGSISKPASLLMCTLGGAYDNLVLDSLPPLQYTEIDFQAPGPFMAMMDMGEVN